MPSSHFSDSSVPGSIEGETNLHPSSLGCANRGVSTEWRVLIFKKLTTSQGFSTSYVQRGMTPVPSSEPGENGEGGHDEGVVELSVPVRAVNGLHQLVSSHLPLPV
jgi:hypothetical protein